MSRPIVSITVTAMAGASKHHNQHHNHSQHSIAVESSLRVAPHNCFLKVMRSHIIRPGCMERRSYAHGPSCTSALPPRVMRQTAVYVLTAAHLLARRASAEKQLKSLCAADVTWVLCCTREQYEHELSDEQRLCIHPCVADTFWNPTGKPFSNGTISLAMKHRAAAIDMMDRNLTSAIVLEDDAHLDPNIWEHLNTVRLPENATIYYLGSYSMRDNAFSGRWGNLTHPITHTELPGQRPSGLHVYQRNERMWPFILGTIGYVIFPFGARVLAERPILATADVDLTAPFRFASCRKLENGSLLKVNGCVSTSCTARNSRGDLTIFELGGAPGPQFGPDKWLVWPIRSFGIGTHKGGHSAFGSQNRSSERSVGADSGPPSTPLPL